MKKLIAFVLSLVMTAALAVPSTAAGPGAVSTTRVAASGKVSHYSLAQMTSEFFLRSGQPRGGARSAEPEDASSKAASTGEAAGSRAASNRAAPATNRARRKATKKTGPRKEQTQAGPEDPTLKEIAAKAGREFKEKAGELMGAAGEKIAHSEFMKKTRRRLGKDKPAKDKPAAGTAKPDNTAKSEDNGPSLFDQYDK